MGVQQSRGGSENVAHDAVDSGGPVKLGGKASTTEPTAVGNGDRVNAWFDDNGRLVLGDYPATLADGKANPTTQALALLSMLFNGSTWDRVRLNHEVTVESSAAVTATRQTSDQTNYNFRGMYIVYDVTAVSGTTPTMDVKLQLKDTLSGNYVDLTATFPQITATGTYTWYVGPGVTDTDSKLQDLVELPVPRVWRLVETVGGTSPSFTRTISVNYVL